MNNIENELTNWTMFDQWAELFKSALSGTSTYQHVDASTIASKAASIADFAFEKLFKRSNIVQEHEDKRIKQIYKK